MKPTQYYQPSAEGACPLVFWKGWDGLSDFELRCLKHQGFQGRLGDVSVLYEVSGHPKVAYVGTGEGTDFEAIAHAVLKLPEGLYQADSLSRKACLNWSLAQYGFDRYRKKEKKSRVLVVEEDQLSEVLLEAEAIYLVRDLINTPANDLMPEALSQTLATIAKACGANFREWVGEDLLTANFPAIYAVGAASVHPPRLLELTWGDEKNPRVSLIGKGVCFDSGGLDLKPSSSMRLMKKDMGGAAQVIGLAQWLMKKKLPIYLEVLIPAVENAVGSKAYRPGDVLTMRNGLTVEVDNTDAEGRLVLADAISKACEKTPWLLVDFATLTGAARVAVGTEISAFFTNEETWVAPLMKASLAEADPLWRMPLHPGYMRLLDSSIADCVNSSPSSYAGAITAALFLEKFVSRGVTWAHFDIMAWNVSTSPGKPEGGEAMGISALAHYLFAHFKS